MCPSRSVECHGKHCHGIKVLKCEEYVKTEKVEPKSEKELPSESAVETELNEAVFVNIFSTLLPLTCFKQFHDLMHVFLIFFPLFLPRRLFNRFTQSNLFFFPLFHSSTFVLRFHGGDLHASPFRFPMHRLQRLQRRLRPVRSHSRHVLSAFGCVWYRETVFGVNCNTSLIYLSVKESNPFLNFSYCALIGSFTIQQFSPFTLRSQHGHL